MESIYNHNVTVEELKTLSKMIPGRRIDERSIYERSIENDLCCADLFRLYTLRNNKGKAMEFYIKIKDPALKYFLKDI